MFCSCHEITRKNDGESNDQGGGDEGWGLDDPYGKIENKSQREKKERFHLDDLLRISDVPGGLYESL